MQTLEKYIPPPPRFAFVFHLQEYKYSPTTTETLKKSTLKIKKVSAADLLRAETSDYFSERNLATCCSKQRSWDTCKIMPSLKLQLILPRKHRLDREKYVFIPNGAVS